MRGVCSLAVTVAGAPIDLDRGGDLPSYRIYQVFTVCAEVQVVQALTQPGCMEAAKLAAARDAAACTVDSGASSSAAACDLDLEISAVMPAAAPDDEGCGRRAAEATSSARAETLVHRACTACAVRRERAASPAGACP